MGAWRVAPRRPQPSGIDHPPWWAWVPAVVATLVFGVPLVALVVKAPWSHMATWITSHDALLALRLSVETSLLATAVALVLGVPLAWVQARVDYPGKRLVRAVSTLPMVLPPVVGGVALLLAFGRRGLVGPQLAHVGIHLPYTLAGAVAAEAFVAMPFLVITLEAGFASVDRRIEVAARSLGASRSRVFWQVTMPLVRPSLVAGAVLCWARALGEFGATVTFNGNLPGTTQTLPLFVNVKLQGDERDAAIALSLVLLAVSFVVLVSLRDRWLTAR